MTTDSTIHPEQAEALSQALEELARAVQACALYGPDHPTTRDALHNAHTRLQSEQTGSVRVGVTSRSLILDESAALDSDPARSLARALHDLDVGVIELASDARETDLAALTAALIHAESEAEDRTQQRESVAGATEGRVKLAPIRLAGLVEHSDLAEGESYVRSELGDIVLSAMRGELGVAPEAAAQQVNQQMRAQNPQMIASLRTEMRHAAQSARQIEGDERFDRLRTFAKTLSPDLREALMRTTTNANDSMEILAELADVVPAEDVMSALGEIKDRDRVSASTLLMLRRLSTVVADDSDQCATLATITSDLAQRDADHEEWLGVLSELLHSRAAGDYAPEDYRKRLEDLRAHVPGEPVAFDLQEIDDTIAQAVRTVEISLDLLEAGIEEPAALLARIEDRIQDCLIAGRFDALTTALQCARDIQDRDTSPQDTSAAKSLLASLTDPKRLDAIINAATTQSPNAKDAADLLASVGEPALAQVLAAAEHSQVPQERDALAHVAAMFGTGALIQSVRAAAQTPDRLTSFSVILSSLSRSAAIEALSPMTNSNDANLRLSAFLALDVAIPEWPADILERGVSDPELQIRAVILNRLSERRNAEGLELLARFVEGDLAQPGATLPERASAASMLAAKFGSLGRERLCQSLDLFKRRKRSPLDGAAREIVAVLMPHAADSKQITLAIRSWRQSLAGILSAIAAPLQSIGVLKT